MANIGIIGSAGRMGAALATAIVNGGDTVSGGIYQDENAIALAWASDALVDFSSPDALEFSVHAAITTHTPIVIGTTGLEELHHQLIDHAAEHVAILQTRNTSLGINMLACLVREAASRLGDEWDIEIVESHHRRKVDSPSGTALMLGEAAASARGIALVDHITRARDGKTGPRERGTIGFASLRGGSVAGDHTVYLLADDERISLTHVAEDRAIFARGAVKAAHWLIGKPAGRYTMSQVLGF
ncbi:MAG: 4-hydroxy-tetrahydrodipicolinate reductase [Pseudomonadota bacterium]|nr:4-hydroxy-tetrahydrodipicolinate reductase [Pseudomonadota bacterium]